MSEEYRFDCTYLRGLKDRAIRDWAVQDIKHVVDKYDEIVKKASKIVSKNNFCGTYVEYKNDMVLVHGYGMSCGEPEYSSHSFPIEWLVLSDEELEAAKKEHKEG